MKIEMKNPVGVHLLTKNRFCRENVDVVPRLEVREITQNGKYMPGEGYAGFGEVNVSVEGGEASLTTKKITANGTYSAGNDGADGYSSVEVAVPEVIPDGYVIPSGNLPITENGDYDIKAYESVSVNVPTGGAGDSTAQPLTVSGNNITYDTAYEYTRYNASEITDWDFEASIFNVKKIDAIFPSDVTVSEILKLAIHATGEIGGQDFSIYVSEGDIDTSVAGAAFILGEALIYVKSASTINAQSGITSFEDNSVYLSNAIINTDIHIPTAIKENGAFFPVTVQVPEPEITTEDVEITPTEETQEVSASNADYIGKVTVKPIPSEYVKPSGTKDITSNGTHDVKAYESVSVAVPEVIPEGYVKPSGERSITNNGTFDVKAFASVKVAVPTEGGGTGGGDIIEVDTLPTENIDENALYLCDGVYYKRVTAFTDVILSGDSTILDMVSYITANGGTASVNTVATLPTEGMKESDVSNGIFHFYYAEDLAAAGEEPCYLYPSGGSWLPLSDKEALGTPYIGNITDESEATEEGYYALFAPKWKAYRSGAGIIDVAELPTENIDESSLYLCGESYYKYIGAFNELILASDASTILPLSIFVAFLGWTISYNTAADFSTEDVKISDPDNNIYHIYYVASANNVFVYGGEELGWGLFSKAQENIKVPFGGFITSTAEAVPGKYYILGGWREYKPISGNITLTEAGTHDVAGKKTATVDVPSVMIVNSAADLPSGASYGTLAYVLGIEEGTT